MGALQIAEPESVLFRWSTVPMLQLPEASRVMEAPGFTYKTHVVSEKVSHHFCYYGSVDTKTC
jgi:hypothetical protein